MLALLLENPMGRRITRAGGSAESGVDPVNGFDASNCDLKGAEESL
jgi:hypothetical protein